LALILSDGWAHADGPEPVTLRFDPDTKYQTFEGWGIVLPCWLFDGIKGAKTLEQKIAAYERYNNTGHSKALYLAEAAEMVERGFNRFRLEVGPQVEFINDNDDPHKLNMKAFRFKWQDVMIEEQLLPMKKLLEARGEKAVLYVSYDLGSGTGQPWQMDPDEYAEMAIATLTHLKSKYKLEPKYWSVINEPGNAGRPGNPKLCARLTAVVGKRIHDAGFRTKMSGPEVVTPRLVDRYMKAMVDTPGALDHFAQLTYHLYWDPNTIEHRRTIRRWSEKLKVTAAQTEWMEQRDINVARHIYLCLTVANVVAWERYGWNLKRDLKNQTFTRDSTAWYVRQYSRFIRPGAVRVKMESPDKAIMPVAFLSPKNKPVVVVINTDCKPRPVNLTNLPPGKYSVSVVPSRTPEKLQTTTVRRERLLSIDLPGKSVVTITADPPAPGPRNSYPGARRRSSVTP